MLWPFCRVQYHVTTAIKFTADDFKTILLPVAALACATAPLSSVTNLVNGMVWLWLHQLLCNVSNQSRSEAEDAVNKPWRPIPSGRIGAGPAVALRWLLVAACVSYSAARHGPDVALASVTLSVTTFVYDELGLSAHHIGKSACNIGGYTALEVGATKLIGATRELDRLSVNAIWLSGAVVFTTIQAQDFPDVPGDTLQRRTTLPIYAPQFARALTTVALCAWSAVLPAFWGIPPLASAVFALFGAVIGYRFYFLRTVPDDRLSYVLYNLWLAVAHTLPLNRRLYPGE
ncbi:hypothetical protein C8Q79DRAFT_129844 [Trametes meyenii]|nr:hypothetical protein C8Q79DRAFT_129844 [Trametes meyenii]